MLCWQTPHAFLFNVFDLFVHSSHYVCGIEPIPMMHQLMQWTVHCTAYLAVNRAHQPVVR